MIQPAIEKGCLIDQASFYFHLFPQPSIIGMIETSSIVCSKKLYISKSYQLGHFASFFYFVS